MLKAMLDKGAIKRSFSRAADSYDSHAGFQRQAAEEVFRLLAPMLPDTGALPRVLDIGCGTGSVAELFASSGARADLCCADMALPMLRVARKKLGVRAGALVACDCEALPFAAASFDAAASSLTFQWAHDLRTALLEAARVLKDGGTLVLSTLGPATLRELRECYPGYGGLAFQDAGETGRALAEAGLKVTRLVSTEVRVPYADFMELVRTLKHIGAAPAMEFGKGLAPARALREAGRLYNERHKADRGAVVATYELITAAAIKRGRR